MKLFLFSFVLFFSWKAQSNIWARNADQRTQSAETILDKNSWKSSLSLGYREHAGNVDQKILSAGFSIAKRFSDISLYAVGSSLMSRLGDNTIQDQRTLTLRADYPSDTKWRFFAFNTHSSNRFLNLDYRGSLGAGPWLQMNQKTASKKTWSHGLSLAPTLVYEEFANQFIQREIRLSLRSLFRLQWDEKNFLGYDLFIKPKSDDFSDLQAFFQPYLETRIYKNSVSLKISYTVEHDSRPQNGVKKTDRQYLTSVNFYLSES